MCKKKDGQLIELFEKKKSFMLPRLGFPDSYKGSGVLHKDEIVAGTS